MDFLPWNENKYFWKWILRVHHLDKKNTNDYGMRIQNNCDKMDIVIKFYKLYFLSAQFIGKRINTLQNYCEGLWLAISNNLTKIKFINK